MKKISTSIIFLTLCLISIGQYRFTESLGYMTVEFNYKNGDDTPAVVKFMYKIEEINAAGITKEEIQTIIRTSAISCPYQAKNKYSYRYSDNTNLITINDDEVGTSIKGSAENSYGTRAEITVYVMYKIGSKYGVNDRIISSR